MKVSIIMSVYNGENYIIKAVDSILNQTYSMFEFIIVDDGSSDNSLKIIEDYKRKDKRIKIIRNKFNLGLTKSLNKAIRCSKGDFIARQDSDDISLPNRLEKQIQFLKNNLDYAFCGSDVFYNKNKEASLKFFEMNEILKNLIISNCFTHSTILIRKSIFEKFGLYNEHYIYGQDYELWCRLIYKYHLKAKNLYEKLVIMNIPFERLSKKSMKFVIQHKNYIKSKFMYLKYTKTLSTILRSLLSILRNILEIVSFLILYVVTLKFIKIKRIKSQT